MFSKVSNGRKKWYHVCAHMFVCIRVCVEHKPYWFLLFVRACVFAKRVNGSGSILSVWQGGGGRGRWANVRVQHFFVEHLSGEQLSGGAFVLHSDRHLTAFLLPPSVPAWSAPPPLSTESPAAKFKFVRTWGLREPWIILFFCFCYSQQLPFLIYCEQE